MAKFLCCAAHDGNAIAVIHVLQELRRRGHQVVMVLQGDYSAAGSYERQDTVWRLLQGVEVRILFGAPDDLEMFDAVVLGTSAQESWNLEVVLLHAAQERGIPRFVIEEVVGGRHNPIWRRHLRVITTLFAAFADPGFSQCEEVCVGPNLSRWRGVSVQELRAAGRAKLGIGDEPLIYFFPSPSIEGSKSLHVLANLLAEMIRDKYLSPKTVFMLNRHRREREDVNIVPGNAEGFQSGLEQIARRVGLRVFDNSPEYDDLPVTAPRAILPQFRPREFLSYQEMLAVTARNGAALTFYGTDAQVIAPFLAGQGILPILWLDPQLGGANLFSEKKFRRFNLPLILQSATNDELQAFLALTCAYQSRRDEHCRQIAEMYPFPAADPAILTVDGILQRITVK